MDGNGRWANSRGLPRLEGHRAGAGAAQRTVEFCLEKKIRYLTLFSFSTENWQRSPQEVSGLMSLFKQYLDTEVDKLLENGIRLRAVGDLDRLPSAVRESLAEDIEKTKHNEALNLIVAVSYGGREEIVTAARKLAARVQEAMLRPDEITVETFAESLWTAGIPDPDLLIRTSGELRISNFLLWQLAYSEIVVTPEYWPDMDKPVLERCLEEYGRRERRFGRASERAAAEAEKNVKNTASHAA